jgi:GDP-L-fucose synthase
MGASIFSINGSRIWIAGHGGMLGQSLIRELGSLGAELVTVDRHDVDLRRQVEVEAWLSEEPVDGIVMAAATVGGIFANNNYPADFIYDNISISTNVIHAAARLDVKKLVMIGSSCMYPRLARQPVAEDSLLTGPLEPTNQWFAIAKIAALKMCQAYRRQQCRNFITVVPTNLYGPGDNFDLETSHVVPAMLRKVETARKDGGPVEIWGTGTPQREFLYVDDAAAAIAALMEHYDHEDPINISGGETVSVLELARRAAEIVGYEGAFETDPSKPDGMPIKQLDNSRIAAMGIWHPKIKLSDGLKSTYDWYCRA